MKRIGVWDLPTRIFHWSLALLVLAAYLTQEFGLMSWHQRIGLTLLGLIAFRLTWGMVGSTYARFFSFVRGPAAILAYLRGSWRGVGHNPLGGWSVLALLLLPLAMALSGLFANDDVDFRGLLADRVSVGTSESLTRLHGRLFDALLILIGLHVAAIAAHFWFKRENLVRPLFTGYRLRADDEADASYSGGGWLALLFALAVAASAIAAVFALVPEPAALPADYTPADW
jgi:cytochrome b